MWLHLAVAPEVVPIDQSAGVAAILSEGGYEAVPGQLVTVEELAVLRGVCGGADGARAGAAVSHATAPVALAWSRTTEQLVWCRTDQWTSGNAAATCC